MPFRIASTIILVALLTGCVHEHPAEHGYRRPWFAYTYFDPSFPTEPLIEAILANDEAAVEKLLRSHCDLGNARRYRTTPLHVAVALDRTNIVQKLLTAGADAALCDWTGYNALSTAVLEGSLDSVRLILRAGFSPDLPNKRGVPRPMMLAVGNPADGRVFTTIAKERLPSYRREQETYSQITALLAEAGADLSFVALGYGSYVHWAEHSGNYRAAEVLRGFQAEKKSEYSPPPGCGR